MGKSVSAGYSTHERRVAAVGWAGQRLLMGEARAQQDKMSERGRARPCAGVRRKMKTARRGCCGGAYDQQTSGVRRRGARRKRGLATRSAAPRAPAPSESPHLKRSHLLRIPRRADPPADGLELDRCRRRISRPWPRQARFLPPFSTQPGFGTSPPIHAPSRAQTPSSSLPHSPRRFR